MLPAFEDERDARLARRARAGVGRAAALRPRRVPRHLVQARLAAPVRGARRAAPARLAGVRVPGRGQAEHGQRQRGRGRSSGTRPGWPRRGARWSAAATTSWSRSTWPARRSRSRCWPGTAARCRCRSPASSSTRPTTAGAWSRRWARRPGSLRAPAPAAPATGSAAVAAGVLDAFDAASVLRRRGARPERPHGRGGHGARRGAQAPGDRRAPPQPDADGRATGRAASTSWNCWRGPCATARRPRWTAPPRRACVYQHVRASRGMLEVLGEHVMGSAGPLQLVPGFFGADEALTDYAPGRDGWAATLIVTAPEAREARERAARGGRGARAPRRLARAPGGRDGEPRRGRPAMTRLTEADVTALTDRAGSRSRTGCVEATGLGLRDLALRTVVDGDRCVQLHGARVAAVPMASGEGVIPGFSACVVATLQHLGCDAWVTTQPDVRGIQAAVAAGAQVLFLADDHRFIALNVTKGCTRRRRPRDGRRLRDGPRGGRGRARGPRGPRARPRAGRARRRAPSGGARRERARGRAGRGARRPRRSRSAWSSRRSASPTGWRAATSIFDASPAAGRHRRRRPAARHDRRRARHAVGVHGGGTGGSSACATSTSRWRSVWPSWRRARCSDARRRRAPRPRAAPAGVQSPGAGGRSEGSAWALNPRRRV